MSGERAVRSLNAHEVHARDLERIMVDAVEATYADVDRSSLGLATRLKRVANILVQRTAADQLGVVDRSSASVRVLLMIWIFEPVEARDLARLSGFTRQAVSAVLTTLERDGLIVRQRGGEGDRRLAPISVTDEGRGLVEKILPLQNREESRFFSVLSAEDQEVLGRLLLKLMGNTLN